MFYLKQDRLKIIHKTIWLKDPITWDSCGFQTDLCQCLLYIIQKADKPTTPPDVTVTLQKALAHNEPWILYNSLSLPLSPVCHQDLSISSQVQTPPLPPRASNDKSFCSCSKDFFFLTSFFTVWVAEQLSTALGNHMVGVKVLHRDVRPFVLRHEAAPDETLLKERERKKKTFLACSVVCYSQITRLESLDWLRGPFTFAYSKFLPHVLFFFFFLSAPF